MATIALPLTVLTLANTKDFADHDIRIAQSFLYNMLTDVGNKIDPLSETVIPRIIHFGEFSFDNHARLLR